MLAERPLTRGTAEQHRIARYLTLAEEVVLQALPQGFFQCLVLLRMARAGEATSWVQWASIGSALVAVGFIGAELEHNIDMDPNDRRRMPQLYGYLPNQKRRRFATLTGVLMYLVGFLATKVNSVSLLSSSTPLSHPPPPPFTHPIKWVVVSALASVSGRAVTGWIGAEFLLFVLLRFSSEGE